MKLSKKQLKSAKEYVYENVFDTIEFKVWQYVERSTEYVVHDNVMDMTANQLVGELWNQVYDEII